MRAEAEEHLRAEYAEGSYVEADIVNRILRRMFDFFMQSLTSVLEQCSSRHFLQFVLYQYDLSCEIDGLYKRALLSAEEEKDWESLGPFFRRATKYLAEKAVMSCHKEAPDLGRTQIAELADLAYIYSESIIRLYSLSDQTFMLFPEETRLEILPRHSTDYMWLTVENSRIDGFQERIRDGLARYKTGDVEDSIIYNVKLQDSVLGKGLLNAIGASWIQAMQVIYNLIEGSVPPDSGFPIPFVRREMAIREVSRTLNLSLEAIGDVLRGFSVSRENMLKEGREIFRPKQEHRLFRRGFLEYEDEAGLHLIFSKEMAREATIHLMAGASFQKLPCEWINPQVRKAQAELSNRAGAWFEDKVLLEFSKLEIPGIRAVRNLLMDNAKRIDIESEVGEIDILAYDSRERLLIVGECKLIDYSFEPRFYRTEIDNFTAGPSSYFSIFARKVHWIRENVRDVAQALQDNRYLGIPVEPARLASVMLTHYLSIVSHFAEEIPCLTVSEFATAWRCCERWPFELGKVTIGS